MNSTLMTVLLLYMHTNCYGTSTVVLRICDHRQAQVSLPERMLIMHYLRL
jgi:hypothetical protein